VRPARPLPLACEEKAVIVARSLGASPIGQRTGRRKVRALLVAAFDVKGEKIEGCEDRQISYSLDGPYAPLPGQLFAAAATFLGWREYHNAGLFGPPASESAPLLFKGYVRDLLLFAHEGEAASLSLDRVRSGLSAHFRRHLGERNSAFLEAMLLGERTTLGWSEQEVLRRAGVYHVLAISGVHISLLAVVFMTLLAGCGISRGRSMRLATALLLVYVILVGGSPPAVRSFIMVAVITGSFLLQRFTSSLNSLLVAALLILLASPVELTRPGFQLSFSAMVGLLVVGGGSEAKKRRKQGIVRRLVHSLSQGIIVSFSAFLAQVPTMVFFFRTLYPVSIVSNILIIPLVGLVLPLGMAFLVASLISGSLAAFLSPVLEAAVNVLFFAAGVFAKVEPLSAGRREFLLLSIASLAGLLCIAGVSVRITAMCLLTAVSVQVLLESMPPGASCPRNSLRIAFLDVGEGDSSVIESGAWRVVIDTGTTGMGRRRSQIGEYLEARGARCVDVLIISHPHDDHFGDALEVIRDFKVRWVVGIEPHWKSESYARLLERLGELGIPYYPPATGDTLKMHGARFVFFNPQEFGGSSPTENDFSLVVRFEAGGFSVLYPGDSEICTERKLIAHAPAFLESDVLKLAHHGSKTSTSEEFLALVNPKIAVMSCERAGRFGHPSREVLARLEKKGCATYRTDVQGGILLLRESGLLDVRTSLPEVKPRSLAY
jgi:competence protein ComEC